jgi:hypothetical protein
MIIDAIYAAAGGENKMGDALTDGKIQEQLGSDHICPMIGFGILNAGSNACLGCEVQDGIDGFGDEGLKFCAGHSTKVGLQQTKAGLTQEWLYVPFFNC